MSIGEIDIASLWGKSWPWLWPSLSLIVGLIGSTFGIRAWERWINGRFQAVANVISPRFIRNLRRVLTLGVWIGGTYLWLLAVPLSQSMRTWLRDYAEPWVLATLVVAVFVGVVFYLVRKGMMWLEARAAETESVVDDALVEALHRPVYVSLALLAFNLFSAIAPIPKALQSYVSKGTETFLVILVILFLDGLVHGWMLARSERSKVLKTSGVVLRTTARSIFYTIGGLMALSALGIDVTPVLATLGIGSAAAGFALKGTLEDFIAGLLIAAEQPLSVGDFVIIDEQHQGWVLQIGWRTTRLLTRFDMHVVVPNSMLSVARFINTSRPREDCRFHALVMLSFREDLDKAVEMASQLGEEVQKSDPRASGGYRSFAYIHEFRPGYVELRTWLCAKSWDAHFGLRDAYLRRLHQAFKDAGMEVANPGQMVELHAKTAIPVVQAAPPSLGVVDEVSHR